MLAVLNFTKKTEHNGPFINMDVNVSLNSVFENQSKDLPEDNQQDTVFIIRRYALPLICFLGILGNSLSAKAFLGPGLKHASCSLYLAVRCISDNGFILTLFTAWLDFVHVRVFHTEAICQIVVFLSYLCSFISVWCVVFVTIENYVRICHHTHVNRFCTIKIARYALLTCFLLALLLYNFSLWGTQVQQHGDQKYCLTKRIFMKLEQVITYIDTALTLVIPLLIILVLMLLIIISSVDAHKRQIRLTSTSAQNNNESRRRVLPHSRVTRLLSSVSIMFLILHTPLHVIRIKVLFEHVLRKNGNETSGSDMDRTLQHIFVTMYYLNFSVNCVIYLVCGENFRKVFLESFCWFCKFRNTELEVEAERFSNVGMTSSLILDKDEETAIQ
ncbi:kappa-type opioid receptor-like [Saccostrea cucullata]|uniref:kappa-type opioid receptor-like n=1 Tax=Saccostrea cuccullata TaxID=36930 RepID=UPI002ED0CD06